MSVMGSSALGAQVDFALSVSWLCPEPCFEKARHSERIRARVYAEHDQRERANRAHLQAALLTDEATLLHWGTLSEGLRVPERDLDRVAALSGDQASITRARVLGIPRMASPLGCHSGQSSEDLPPHNHLHDA